MQGLGERHLPQDHHDVACPLIELDRVLQQHPPHHAAARVHTNGVAQQRAGGTGVRAPPTLRTARLPQAGKHEISLSLSPLSLALSLVAHSQHTHMHMHRAWAWACGTGMCTAHCMAHSACVRASGVTVLLYCAWSSCRHVRVHVCARLEQLLAEGTRHWRRQVPPPPLLPKGACREGAK